MSGTRLLHQWRNITPVTALLAANLISQIGNFITFLAVPWFVLETTGSASRAGITVAVGGLPVIIAGILGGAIVDRLGYKRTSIYADLASGVAVICIPLLHQTVGIAFWQLLTLVFLGALLDVPGITARRSLFPELIEQTGIGLERANAFYAIVNRTAGILGPALAGVLIAILGPSHVLWIDGATFAISAAIVASLIPAGLVSAPETSDRGLTRYFREIREGFQFLWRDPVLISLALVLAIGGLLAEPLYGVILPVYAREIFGSAVSLGFIFAALAAGSFTGNVVYMIMSPRLSRRLILITGISVRALTFWVLLTLPPFWVVAASIFINAMFFEPLNPLVMTIFQERVPAGMRGRVFGVNSSLGGSTLPVGLLAYGLLLDDLGLQDTLIVLAIFNLAMPIAAVALPSLRDMSRPQPASARLPVVQEATN